MSSPPEPEFNLKQHVPFLKYVFHKGLPGSVKMFQMADTQHLSIVYFFVGGLRMLKAWDSASPIQAALKYHLKACYAEVEHDDEVLGGFTFIPMHTPSTDDLNITATFQALSICRMTGIDPSFVSPPAVSALLRHLVTNTGAIRSSVTNGEADMRFMFSAHAVQAILGLSVLPDPVPHLIACQTHDGSFAQAPGLEGHSGSSFCAVATLKLCGGLDRLDPIMNARLVRYLVHRQETGFNGRPNKVPDSCYTFWVGASLKILGKLDLVNRAYLLGFVKRCENILTPEQVAEFMPTAPPSPDGRPMPCGFSKSPTVFPDPLHTFMSLCGLALLGAADGQLAGITPELVIPV